MHVINNDFRRSIDRDYSDKELRLKTANIINRTKEMEGSFLYPLLLEDINYIYAGFNYSDPDSYAYITIEQLTDFHFDQLVLSHPGQMFNKPFFDEDLWAARHSYNYDINSIRSKTGLNLLEYAIFNKGRIDVSIIESSSRLNIRNISGTPCCYPHETTRMNALLNAVRFSDVELLERLEKRVESNVAPLNASLTNEGDNALCLTLMHNRDQNFLQYLIKQRNIPLLPCNKSQYSLFMSAINLSARVAELELITHAICNSNTTCRTNLVCNDRELYENSNSVQFVSKLEGNHNDTLDFLFENGANDCWQDRDDKGRDSYQIAKFYNRTNIVNYYDNNVISPSYRIKQKLPDDNTILATLILLPIIISLIFFLIKYSIRWTRRYFEDYSAILASYARLSKLRSLKYRGQLEDSDILNKNEKYFMKYKQLVSLIPMNFIPFNALQKNYEVQASYGAIPNLLVEASACKIKADMITFYIPGTGSSVENPLMEASIASHLSHALNSKVLLIHHQLAPHAQWPIQLNEVCHCIRYYIKKHKPLIINLAGYSIGGFLATLSTMVLLNYGIRINRLILFAPALDISCEFRSMPAASNKYDHYRPYLPKKFQNNSAELAKLQQHAQ